MTMDPGSCLITGATNGIGLATALELARRGFLLLLHGRDAKKLARTEALIRAEAPNCQADYLLADFADLDQVCDLAGQVNATHQRLDVLINNAGLLTDHRQVSADGFELCFAVNHLAPLLLSLRLQNLMIASAPARIAFNSSSALGSARLDLSDLQMERSFDGWTAYANTKLANMLVSMLFARDLAGQSVVCNAFCPGLIDTGLLRNNRDFGPAGIARLKPSMRSPAEGAVTAVFLASDPAAATMSGNFFLKSHGGGKQPLDIAWDKALAEELWSRSLELLKPWLSS